MTAVSQFKEGMHREVHRPETFPVAFAKLQAAIKPAIKDSTNPHFKSRYADLGAVWEAVKQPLVDNGFSIIQSPDFDGENMYLKTIIMHTSGEYISGRFPLRPSKPDPQGYGSALTYARRYSISAMLGVIADEDDDGNAASAKPSANGAAPNPQRDAIHNSPTMSEDPDVTEGVKNWVKEQEQLLMNCKTVEDIQGWEESRADALDRLRRKALPAWSGLMKFKEARIGNINLQGAKA